MSDTPALPSPEDTDNSPRPEDGDQHLSQEPASAYDPSGQPVTATQ